MASQLVVIYFKYIAHVLENWEKSGERQILIFF